MNLSTANLVDLVVAVIVVLVVAGALKRGSGLLGAAASGVVSLVGLWLIAVAVVAWGPSGAADVTASSRLVTSVPYPHHAVEQVQSLVGHDRSARP